MATSPQRFTQKPAQTRRKHAEIRIVSVSRRASDQALAWLVTGPRNERRYFTVMQVAGMLHCDCQEGRTQPDVCPHQVVVSAWLKAHQGQMSPVCSAGYAHRPSQDEQREQAFLSNSDQPFSIWKS